MTLILIIIIHNGFVKKYFFNCDGPGRCPAPGVEPMAKAKDWVRSIY